MNPAAALVIAGLTLAAPAQAARFEFEGVARNLAGTETLYREKHEVSGECRKGRFVPTRHRVHYRRNGDAEPFASKDLHYQGSLLRPAMDFRQPMFDEALSVEYPSESALEITWRTPNAETRRYRIGYGDDVVVDAGFDNLVRRHWASLAAGERVNFRFLGPTRGEHYAFALERVNSPAIEAALEVRIQPTGLLLQFLVDPIYLGYNARGALTDYLGLTNIRQNADGNYQAHIRYTVQRYPDCELTP